ncbi:MAG: UDP-3-O-(3-hydroxymyristoyl)glucosamine N-acyltransferase [Brevirhabdus sp.]
MTIELRQIAEALDARLEGDGSIRISGLAEPAAAGPGHLALAMSETYADGLKQGRARAAVLWAGADWRAIGLEAALFVDRPRMAMSAASSLFEIHPFVEPGVHPTAHVDPTAELGRGAAIGPFAVIGPGAQLGNNARVLSHCCIGRGVVIGDDALLHAGVRIGERVRIGDRFIAQPGAVVGGDGFSFVTPEKSGAETARETLAQTGDAMAQSWHRIASLGAVEIGDDVELGANSTIDRGTIRSTRIGSGSKLDNLVQIGHNVVIGRDCLVCGQAGVAGSTRLGDRVVVGGHSAINDNIKIGDDVVIGGGSRVASNVPTGRAVWGFPATRMDQAVEGYKLLRRLPRLFDQVAKLQKAVSKSGQSD